MAKVSLVSLGCPKNLVDSEHALGELARAGHELIVDKSRAEVIIVNTCGFIDSARAESVEAILDALECKNTGKCRVVAVMGCLSQRFGDELAQELPEVDVLLGIDSAESLISSIERALGGKRVVDRPRPAQAWVEHAERVRSTPPWTAYLKVSDGCDNRCAYCAIPDIRGRFRSRPREMVIEEARRLAGEGVRELVLIGQDLTQYGCDTGVPNCLPDLLERLNEIDDLRWIRLMYCYPTKVTPELIEAISTLDKVVKYVDLPLQHGDDRVLQAMNRRGNVDQYLRVIDSLRAGCPEIALRTTFIVGFPGEDAAALDNLLAFVERIQFDRVGVFTYSREEGTPAAAIRKRVIRKTAEARADALMKLQQGISLARNRCLVGRRMEVLVEGTTDDGLWGRSYRDAPEIDGIVRVKDGKATPGEFVEVTITGASEYDLESKGDDN